MRKGQSIIWQFIHLQNDKGCELLKEQCHLVHYLDGLQAKLNALCELQSASGEELRPLFGRTLMPSILDKALVPRSI